MTLTRIDGASRPTAGALRLVEAGTATPTTVDIAAYTQRMTAHCPYLAASLQHGFTTWTVYRVDGEAEAVEAELFHAGAQAAERLRPLIRRPHGTLLCENIVLLGDAQGARHRDLMTWPYWALRHLYGPIGIMFGKFYAGEEELTRSGERSPAAPVSFLPVRAAIRGRDPRFLRSTPELAAALAAGEDDGRDVYQHLSYDWQEIRRWSKRHLPRAKPSASSRTTSAAPARPAS
ncbi:hypothetical protein ABZ990_27555 [Streptomyces sp. NPDC046203]|uniref:hypothetical protein n=1 Tax=Streptomyces sp. NPDC046203 TaxID=3154602 RepID=UPI00340CC8EC